MALVGLTQRLTAQPCQYITNPSHTLEQTGTICSKTGAEERTEKPLFRYIVWISKERKREKKKKVFLAAKIHNVRKKIKTDATAIHACRISPFNNKDEPQ